IAEHGLLLEFALSQLNFHDAIISVLGRQGRNRSNDSTLRIDLIDLRDDCLQHPDIDWLANILRGNRTEFVRRNKLGRIEDQTAKDEAVSAARSDDGRRPLGTHDGRPLLFGNLLLLLDTPPLTLDIV